MKNINHIKHFKNIKNISNNKKRRLACKNAKKKALAVLESEGYMDFIAKVKSKLQSDDEIVENLELANLSI